jgi:chromosome segregation ATPase
MSYINNTRKIIFSTLDEMHENDRLISVTSVHDALPEVKSRASIHRYLNEWKEDNKAALADKEKGFSFSPSLNRLLNKEVNNFLGYKISAFEDKLRTADEQANLLNLTLQHVESKNKDLQERLAEKEAELKAANKENQLNIRANTKLEIKLEQKTESLTSANASLKEANKSTQKAEALNNKNNTTITSLNEKLKAQTEANKLLDIQVARIPVLEENLIELPVLTKKVREQQKDIASLTEELEKTRDQLDTANALASDK